MTIGENIRAIRKQKNLRQTELSRRCRLSQGQLSEYETGKSIPSIKILSTIADALEVSVAVLDERLLNSFPAFPQDDFFKILLKNWPMLTNEQRGKLASDSVTMAEKNQSLPPVLYVIRGEKETRMTRSDLIPFMSGIT